MSRTSTPTNGQAIRAIRERSNLSVQEVCDLLASLGEPVTVHPNHLRNVETGARRGGPKLVNGLAQILRVPVVALLGPTESHTQAND